MAFKDSDFISKDDHELNYVLKKYSKRQTKGNRFSLLESLRAFKNNSGYAPHNRRDFYRYVDVTGCIEPLENKKT